MPALKLSVLRPLGIQLGDKSLEQLRVRTGRALLIYLSLENRVHAREQLVELIWPGMLSQSGRKNLRQSLYELRRAIPEVASKEGSERVPLLIGDRQTVALNPQAGIEVDAAEFETLSASSDPAQLEEAVALYQTDFLNDFYLAGSNAFEQWVASRRAKYRRQMMIALDRLVQLAAVTGEYQKAERLARRQLELEDLHEPAVRQLMQALVAQGRRGEALKEYGLLESRLGEALETSPSAETTALFQAIQLDAAARTTEMMGDKGRGRTQKVGPTPTRDAEPRRTPHNLPEAPTPFIGRAHELDALRSRLVSPECRLLTLLGPGGIGKTRLAQMVARRLLRAEPFADGVWFVPLASLNDEEQIASAITATLRLELLNGDASPQQNLLEFLRGKRMLLLLDNIEHLLTTSPQPLLQQILAVAPFVTLLITSRVQLRLQGEQIWQVEGLSLPQGEAPEENGATYLEWGRSFDAVRLFETSARRVQPDFTLNAANLSAVIDIGRRVEGFPLGLEMAAAWLEMLSAAEIEAELGKSLELLEADWPYEGDHHRSARAVFDWSWRLLDERERDLCQALSVFRSGFSREAALNVGRAALTTLLSLSRKSWLQSKGDGRFQMHEFSRQFAQEKLNEDPEFTQQVLHRHAAYYASYFERQTRLVRGPRQREVFEAIEVDYDNLRLAWEWLDDRRRYQEIVRGFLPTLFVYATLSGKGHEAWRMIRSTGQHAITNRQGQDELAATLALNTAAHMLNFDFFKGELVEAPTAQSYGRFAEFWEILEAESTTPMPSPWFIYTSTIVGWKNKDRGLERLRSQVEFYKNQGDRWSQACALQQLGQLQTLRVTGITHEQLPGIMEELQESRAVLEEALTLFAAQGDAIEQWKTLGSLGFIVRGGDPQAALDHFQRAKSLLVAAGLPVDPINDIALSHNHIAIGNYDEAFRILEQMRRACEKHGHRSQLAGLMSMESMQAVRYGDLDHARVLREKSLRIYRELEHDVYTAYGLYEWGEIERVSGHLSLARQRYKEGLVIFEAQPDPHGQAFCYRGLGDTAVAEGDYERAQAHFHRALNLAGEFFGHRWLTSLTYSGLGRGATGLGDFQAADEYLAAAALNANLGGLDFNDLLMVAFTGLGERYLAAGETERALVLCAFVCQQPVSWRETRRLAGDLSAKGRQQLSSATAEAAEQRGCQMDVATALQFAGWD